jgi:fructose-1,6-bisphosphatase II
MFAAPAGVYYMRKLAVGRAAAPVVDLGAPIAENLARIAQARSVPIHDVTVTILDRPRHEAIIDEVRATGARIRLIMDGDVAAAIQAAMDDYQAVDVYMGIGGAPEAVLAAAALKCIGGQMLCQIWPRTEEEGSTLEANGIDLKHIYTVDDLITTARVSFAATGITTGELLKGVEYTGSGARTHSVMMRGHTGTIRFIEGVHRWKR